MTDARNIVVDPLNSQDENREDPTVEDVEQELSATEPEETPDDLPEKYRGKSVRDIIEMHQNAEKALGKKNAEIGDWRSVTQQLILAKREADLGEPEETELSSDDLFDNPQEAIRKVLQRELDKRLAPVEQNLVAQQASAQEQALLARHPDAVELSNSKEFADWVQKSERRMMLAAAAAQGDYGSADFLLETYKEVQPTAPKAAGKAKESGVDAARRVATERGGSGGPVSSQKVYDATDIARMIQRDPRKYNSPEFQAELLSAIKDGRVRGL